MQEQNLMKLLMTIMKQIHNNLCYEVEIQHIEFILSVKLVDWKNYSLYMLTACIQAILGNTR